VSIGIVECAGEIPSSLIAAERLTLPLEKRSREQTIAALKQRLVEAGRRVITAGRAVRPAESIHCVLRAPWTQSRTSRAGTAYDHEEYVSKKTITELAQRALEDARAPRQNFLEASVMQVALNGYPTSAPEGKRAHKVDVAALVCAADPALTSAVREALETLFPGIPAFMHSGTRGIMESLDGDGSDEQDRLVLDVAEEGTAAIVIREGVVASEAYVAEGEGMMLARAVPGQSAEETLATLRMMARGASDSAVSSGVESGLANMEPDLARAFGEFFAALGAPHRLPRAVALIARPYLAPWLTRFFSRIDFAQFTAVSQPFDITPFKAPRHLAAAGGAEEADTDLLIALPLINKRDERR